jgi:alpha-tubulin suppressor-like RCC1 family protein
LRADGTLWTWGYNFWGQMGIGTFGFDASPYTHTPQQVGTNANWQDVAASWAHTVALRADGTLWAWGFTSRGALGLGTFAPRVRPDDETCVNRPQQVGANANWQAIAAGGSHTVALRADGTLWAWGDNASGALGLGTFTTHSPYGISTPQQVGTDTNWGPPP